MVRVKYAVVREGEGKTSFTNRKEADAHGKMLGTVDLFDAWLERSPVALEDEQCEALFLRPAEQKDALSAILKNGKLSSPQAVENDAHTEDDTQAAWNDLHS